MKILIFLLIGFYSLTTYLALTPNVNESYFNYYISNSTDFTVYDKNRLNNLKIGQIVTAESNQIYFDRWIQPSSHVRISKNAISSIIFSLDNYEINNCKCTLELAINPLWKQSIEIFINDTLQITTEINQFSIISISLDKKLLNHGLNYISFTLKDAKKIKYSDTFKSSLEFYWLKFN